jgi:hypothetical protein
MFTPAGSGGGSVTQREVQIYFEAFNEELDKLIPSALKGFYEEGKRIKVHALPADIKYATTLEWFGGQTEDGVTRVPLDEYADYRNLDSIEPKEIIAGVKALALMAAESYISNVKNAYIRGGRLRGLFSKENLHVTDWKGAFHVNVVENGQGLCIDEVKPLGWCAFRYRFAAAKL